MRGMESLRGQRNKNDFKYSLGESSFLYPSRMRRKEGRGGREEGSGEGGKGRRFISLSSRGGLSSGAV